MAFYDGLNQMVSTIWNQMVSTSSVKKTSDPVVAWYTCLRRCLLSYIHYFTLSFMGTQIYSSLKLTRFRLIQTCAAACWEQMPSQGVKLETWPQVGQACVSFFFMITFFILEVAWEDRAGCIFRNFAQFEISASKNPTQGKHLACFISRYKFTVFRNAAIWSCFLTFNIWRTVCFFLSNISKQKKTALKIQRRSFL